MIRWHRFTDTAPPTEAKYLVFCRSQDANSPFYSTAWYHPESQEWTLIDRYWASAIGYWAELTPPEVVI